MKKFLIILISWTISGLILIPCLLLSLIDSLKRDYHYEFHTWWFKTVLNKL